MATFDEKWGARILESEANPLTQNLMVFGVQFAIVFLLLVALRPSFVVVKRDDMHIAHICILRVTMIALLVSGGTLYASQISKYIQNTVSNSNLA